MPEPTRGMCDRSSWPRHFITPDGLGQGAGAAPRYGRNFFLSPSFSGR